MLLCFIITRHFDGFLGVKILQQCGSCLCLWPSRGKRIIREWNRGKFLFTNVTELLWWIISKCLYKTIQIFRHGNFLIMHDSQLWLKIWEKKVLTVFQCLRCFARFFDSLPFIFHLSFPAGLFCSSISRTLRFLKKQKQDNEPELVFHIFVIYK